MNSLLVALVLTAFSLPALAGKISCGGTEPFWGLSVEGEYMRYSDPVMETTMSLKIVSRLQPVGYSEGYIQVIKSKFTSLTMVHGECNDGMSDEIYTHHAVFDNNGVIMGGCCNVIPASEDEAIGK